MPAPFPIIRSEHTGRVSARRGWFGRIVMQVELRCTSYEAFDFGHKWPISTWLTWRDVTWADITARAVFGERPT